MDVRAGSIGKSAADGDSPLVKRKRPRRAHADGLDAMPIARQETRHTDTREQDRRPAHGKACKVTCRGADHDAEILNLSGGGAMIAIGLQPNVAERLDLHFGSDGTVECIVRWVKPGRIGVEFAHETHLDCPAEEQVEVLQGVVDRLFPTRRTGSVPAPRPANDPTDERVAKRHPLIWSAELHSRTGQWRVRLRNVSQSGALIQCSKPLTVGQEVALDLGKGGSVDAKISWAVGDHAGLAFDEPFDMRRLSHSKPTVAPARWLRPAYLEGDVPEDSAWDEAWSRMSVDELKLELEGFLKR